MTKAAKKKKASPGKLKGTGREIDAKRSKAYGDMEPRLCDVVRMGEIAASLFDCSDQGLFVFAVGHLNENVAGASEELLRRGIPDMRRRRRLKKRKRQRLASHARRLRR